MNLQHLEDYDLDLAQRIMSELQSVAGDRTETPSSYQDACRRISARLIPLLKTLRAYEEMAEQVRGMEGETCFEARLFCDVCKTAQPQKTTYDLSCHTYFCEGMLKSPMMASRDSWRSQRNSILKDLDDKLKEIDV